MIINYDNLVKLQDSVFERLLMENDCKDSEFLIRSIVRIIVMTMHDIEEMKESGEEVYS